MTTFHIIITAFLALFLWWLLKEYPTWRQKQLQMAKQSNSTTIDSTQQLASSPSTQQQQDSLLGNISTGNDKIGLNNEKSSPSRQQEDDADDDDDIDTTASTTPDQSAKAPALNLTQYTLMIPMAVVYLIGRTMIDITRGCVFHMLYKAEQAAPVVDAWLFDKLTVWLPKKYDQMEVWWATRGRLMYHEWQHTMIHHTIPKTVDAIDIFFLHVYNASRVLVETAHKIGDSLRLFHEKHDWRQLVIDFGNIGYTLFWQPFVSVVAHLYKLGKLFYQGCWYGMKATWSDLRWTVTVGIPMIMDWITATRGWNWMKQIYHWCEIVMKKAVFHIVIVSSPVLYWFGRWMVRSGDVLGMWIQSKWVQNVWRHVRCAFINGCVWLGGELIVLMRSVKTMITTMVDNGIVPIIQLFVKYVLPRLSHGYQQFLAKSYFIYQLYIQPVGQEFIAWCSRILTPLAHVLERWYQALLIYLSRWRWDGIIQVSMVITQSLLWMMGWLSGSLMPAIKNVGSTLTNHHLPLTVEFIQSGWMKMVNDLDTSTIVSAFEQFYQVIQEQCSLIFASLERTMNEWKEAQQESDRRTVNGKVSKIS